MYLLVLILTFGILVTILTIEARAAARGTKKWESVSKLLFSARRNVYGYEHRAPERNIIYCYWRGVGYSFFFAFFWPVLLPCFIAFFIGANLVKLINKILLAK
ncbi:hypothetical protein [Xanthomonas phage JGB6]|nr:hypothetical protein [Xanthomonas phage JGB6]